VFEQITALLKVSFQTNTLWVIVHNVLKTYYKPRRALEMYLSESLSLPPAWDLSNFLNGSINLLLQNITALKCLLHFNDSFFFCRPLRFNIKRVLCYIHKFIFVTDCNFTFIMTTVFPLSLKPLSYIVKRFVIYMNALKLCKGRKSLFFTLTISTTLLQHTHISTYMTLYLNE